MAAFKAIIVDFMIALLVRGRQVGHNTLGRPSKLESNFVKSCKHCTSTVVSYPRLLTQFVAIVVLSNQVRSIVFIIIKYLAAKIVYFFLLLSIYATLVGTAKLSIT